MTFSLNSKAAFLAMSLALTSAGVMAMEGGNSNNGESFSGARSAVVNDQPEVKDTSKLKDWRYLLQRSLAHRDRPEEDKPLTVWSFDGGGIIGILGAHAYAVGDEVSQLLKKGSIFEHVDVIAGTSTGGIFAIAANLPGENGNPKLSPIDILRIYRYYGGLIFKKSVSNHFNPMGLFSTQYDQQHLKLLMEHFCKNGENPILYKDLLKPVFTASYCTTLDEGILLDSSNGNQVRDLLASPVALSTAAAPTYLDPIQLIYQNKTHTFVDGGVWENDPALVTVNAIREYYKEHYPHLKGVGLLRLASFGAGLVEQDVTAERLKGASLTTQMPIILSSLFNSREKGNVKTLTALQGEHEEVMKSTNSYGLTLCDYHRSQIPLQESVKALDNVNPDALDHLMKLSDSRCLGDEYIDLLAKTLGVSPMDVRTVIDQAIKNVSTKLSFVDLSRNHFYDHVAPIGEYIFKWQVDQNFNISKYLKSTVRFEELTPQTPFDVYLEKILWMTNFMVHNMTHNNDKTWWSGMKDYTRKGSHVLAQKAASSIFGELCQMAHKSGKLSDQNEQVAKVFQKAASAYKASLADLFAQSKLGNGLMAEYKESIESGISIASCLPQHFKNLFLTVLGEQIERSKEKKSVLSMIKDTLYHDWHADMLKKIEAARAISN